MLVAVILHSSMLHQWENTQESLINQRVHHLDCVRLMIYASSRRPHPFTHSLTHALTHSLTCLTIHPPLHQQRPQGCTALSSSMCEKLSVFLLRVSCIVLQRLCFQLAWLMCHREASAPRLGSCGVAHWGVLAGGPQVLPGGAGYLQR